jgi:hypothetical protein
MAGISLENEGPISSAEFKLTYVFDNDEVKEELIKTGELPTKKVIVKYYGIIEKKSKIKKIIFKLNYNKIFNSLVHTFNILEPFLIVFPVNDIEKEN